MKTSKEIIEYWCKTDMGGFENLIRITQINAYNAAIEDILDLEHKGKLTNNNILKLKK